MILVKKLLNILKLPALNFWYEVLVSLFLIMILVAYLFIFLL